MVTFTHVLYPTDLSDASAHAARYAAIIARWYRARLTVLHVVPTLEAAGLPADGLLVPGPEFYPPPAVDVEAEMQRAVAADIPADLSPRFMSLVGSPTRTIVDEAVTTSADLIVMGTHGRSGFDRLVSGSVTEKVLRRAPCPVLTIPPRAPAHANQAVFTRILCPVDFSPASKQALGFALDLARQANGRLTLLTVVEWLAEAELGSDTPTGVNDYVRDLMADAGERLHALVSDEPRTWCDIDEVVVAGRAHREILRLASADRSDLIVMGAHGRGGLGLAFLGSTTPAVVRSAECPVLVVHDQPVPAAS